MFLFFFLCVQLSLTCLFLYLCRSYFCIPFCDIIAVQFFGAAAERTPYRATATSGHCQALKMSTVRENDPLCGGCYEAQDVYAKSALLLFRGVDPRERKAGMPQIWNTEDNNIKAPHPKVSVCCVYLCIWCCAIIAFSCKSD